MSDHTILIVDDSSTIRRIIKNELTAAGYNVITAKDGMEALAVIEWAEQVPDLITLDIDMPVMGGFEVCEKLRSAKEHSDRRKQEAAAVPVLFVSANDSLENRRRGFRLEVIDFIAKPFKKGDIVRAVDKVLRPEQEFRGMTALVVDDSDKVRRVIGNILSRKGLQVVEAKNGLQALKIIEENTYQFDIVTIDQIMPEMCGDEFCSMLQQQERMAQVPKFFISASNDREAALRFFQAGATDYLSKPFIEEEFQARVDIHLRARKYVRELQWLNEKLQFIAVRDSLTGLFNRGYIQDKLDKGFEQARRANTPYATILFDIDHFKTINDDCGHAFGDLVIVDFANMLKTIIDKKDSVGRYGGEEFIVLLPNTEGTGAVSLANSIRRKCESYPYSDRSTSIRVTVSAGVAALPNATITSPDELLRRTDEALYLAKTTGRNRVCCYGQDEGNRR